MRLRKALKSLVLAVALVASAAVSFSGDAGKARGGAVARITEMRSGEVEVATCGIQLGQMLA